MTALPQDQLAHGTRGVGLHTRGRSARVALGCVLAATSAVLLTLAFAPYDAWWLVWFAFVPMVVAQYRVLPGLSGKPSAAIVA